MTKNEKHSIENQINKFLEIWDFKALSKLLEDIIPLVQLYDIELDKDDWVQKEVGGDEMNVQTVRLVRTVYLLSKLSAEFSGKFSMTNSNFKDLWKKMEKQI